MIVVIPKFFGRFLATGKGALFAFIFLKGTSLLKRITAAIANAN
jgi:hypothetical protein